MHTTTQTISARLRSLRLSKNLSLRDVQILSNGRIPAVVLGSYERGDRSLSVSRAIQIAEIYQMPLTYLLSEPKRVFEAQSYCVIDLRRLRLLISERSLIANDDELMRAIITFISAIVELRNDWNGEVLSIRESDVKLVALASGSDCERIVVELERNELLIKLER